MELANFSFFQALQSNKWPLTLSEVILISDQRKSKLLLTGYETVDILETLFWKDSNIANMLLILLQELGVFCWSTVRCFDDIYASGQGCSSGGTCTDCHSSIR